MNILNVTTCSHAQFFLFLEQYVLLNDNEPTYITQEG